MLASTSYQPDRGRITTSHWTPWRAVTPKDTPAWPAPNHSQVIICSMPKVASGSLDKMGPAISVDQLAMRIADLRTLRVAVVRHPFDRFMSWYNDKVIHGPNSLMSFYNSVLIGTTNATRFSASEYAASLAVEGMTWNLEPHLRAQTRHCAFDSLRFDLVVDLKSSGNLHERINALLGQPDAIQPLPSTHNYSAVQSYKKNLTASDLGCDEQMQADLYRAYKNDFISIAKHGVVYATRYECDQRL